MNDVSPPHQSMVPQSLSEHPGGEHLAMLCSVRESRNSVERSDEKAETPVNERISERVDLPILVLRAYQEEDLRLDAEIEERLMGTQGGASGASVPQRRGQMEDLEASTWHRRYRPGRAIERPLMNARRNMS